MVESHCLNRPSIIGGLVSLLRQFPKLNKAIEMREWLTKHINKDNIDQEIAYFNGKYNKSYERTVTLVGVTGAFYIFFMKSTLKEQL